MRADESELKSILDNLLDLVAITDLHGNFTFAGKSHQVLGYEDGYLIGKSVMDFVHPDDLPEVQAGFADFIKNKRSDARATYRNRCADGSYLWFETIGNLVSDADGTPREIVFNTRNITERMQAEQKLRALEAEKSALLEANPDLMFLFDREGHFVDYEAANQGELLMAPSGFLKQHVSEILPPDVADITLKHIEKVFKDGEAQIYEYPLEISGEKQFFESRMVPCGNDRALAIVRDITGKKQNEVKEQVLLKIANATFISEDLESLMASIKRLLHKLIDTTNFYVAFYDKESDLFSTPYQADEKDQIETWPAKNSVTGLVVKKKKALLLKKPELLEIMQSDQVEQIGNMCEVWLGVPLFSGLEVTGVLAVQDYHNPDAYDLGSQEILEFVSSQVSMAIQRNVFVQDLKQAKESAEENETRFKALHNASFGGIAIHDKGIILDCNQGLAEITGYSAEELIGMNGLLLIAENTRDKVMQNILANYEKPYEAIGKRKNGEVFPLRIAAKNIPYKGKTARVTEFRDITEDKKKEQALQVALDRAQESDRLKSAFLANMSHEIRTPMNGIMGFAELLKDPHLSGEEQKKYIDIIEQSGVRMLNIINDIVDISRIEAGVMEVDLAEYDINEQLDYIYVFFRPQVEAKGMQLKTPDKLPKERARVFTDREKLLAVLTNLVKNALKYSRKGHIQYGCRDKGSLLEFFVKDTGIGIPKARQKAIFDRFVQADIEDREAREGAGLGLAIAKAYVEMLGGEIRLESEEGQGSVFYFTIPCDGSPEGEKTAGKDESPETMAHPSKKLKILIVEDDKVSSMLIKEYVDVYARETLQAFTGEEAVQTCRQQPDIDLVLMDIKMPVMDGIDAAREIRRFNKEVVIVAQTAKALTGDRTHAMEAGFNEYITKPINKEGLLQCIARNT